jgi:hypothetical protein
MPSADRFIGTWILDPSACNYALGAPPREGRYTISREGAALKVLMSWMDDRGQQLADAFSAVPDGSLVAFSGPGVEHISMELVSDRILDSSAYREGKRLMLARRVLSEDGRTMTVVMSGPRGDGSQWENRAVYRLVPA